MATDQIRLRMAGTGNAFAKRFFNNNAIIERPGFRFMIDFGVTAPMALHRMGIPLNAVQAVLITHLHGDHYGGLEELAFQSLYRYGHRNGKIRLYLPDALAGTLWEHTLKGGLLDERNGLVSLEHYFDVRLVQEGKPCRIADGLEVELVSTLHVPGKPNYALFINNRVFYSGDTVFNPSLLEHAARDRGCRTILHECQLEGNPVVHTGLSELMTLPEDIQSMIWLMHYDDTMPDYIGKTGPMRFLEQHKPYEF